MGIRKKIMVGFLSIVLLLFFSGLISLFELNRLSRTTQNLLDNSSKNIELSKQMLDAVQDQNTALLQIIVLGDNSYDSLYQAGKGSFNKALSEATVTIRDLSELDSIYLAREAYNAVVNSQLESGYTNNIDWFVNVYKTHYSQLTSSIKNYMTSSQNSLAIKASQLENNAYRAITPSVITLLVLIMVVLMFMFLVDLYYIKPILRINKSLGDFMTLKIPFNVKMEGNDEVAKLRDKIESLILLYKNKKSE